MEINLIFLITILLLIVYFFKKTNNLKKNNKQLSQLLQNKESELNSLIDMYDNNVIASKTDLKGRITYASKKFCKTCEYTQEELLGQPHNIIKHPYAPKEIFKNLWSDLKANKTWTGEVFNLSKNGRSYWVETIITPEFNNEGVKIGYSSIRHDISAKKELEELTLTLEQKVKERTKELEKLAITDGLTNLYNRRFFEKMLEQEFKRSKREKTNFIFSIFDVDMFKQYNDTYGHIKGDKVLIEISAILTNLTKRANDLAFRIGGEEFCIITSSMNENEAIEFFQTIRNSIEEEQIDHKKSLVSPYVTASFGLVVVDFNNMSNETFDKWQNVDEIHKLADQLLYKAKENGRNCIEHELI